MLWVLSAILLLPMFLWADKEDEKVTTKKGVTTYPAPEEIAPSELYEASVVGQPCFVYPCTVGETYRPNGSTRRNPPETSKPEPAAFCYFDTKGPTEVEVTVLGPASRLPLKSLTVRPLRHRIKPTIDGNKARLTIPGPCKLSIEPNGNAWAALHVFAGVPEKERITPETPGITRYFGPGVHVLGHTNLESNTSVYIAGGAVVYGQVQAVGVENIRIFGKGILDASKAPRKHGKIKKNKFGRYTTLIKAHFCRNISVEGIHLIDSPAWTIQAADCDNVTVRDVRLITWRENGDGIDLCSVRNGLVEDCFARTWDDTLLVKGLWADREKKQIRWVGMSKEPKEKLARFKAYSATNITFRNISVTGPQLKSCSFDGRANKIDRVTIEGLKHNGKAVTEGKGLQIRRKGKVGKITVR